MHVKDGRSHRERLRGNNLRSRCFLPCAWGGRRYACAVANMSHILQNIEKLSDSIHKYTSERRTIILKAIAVITMPFLFSYFTLWLVTPDIGSITFETLCANIDQCIEQIKREKSALVENNFKAQMDNIGRLEELRLPLTNLARFNLGIRNISTIVLSISYPQAEFSRPMLLRCPIDGVDTEFHYNSHIDLTESYEISYLSENYFNVIGKILVGCWIPDQRVQFDFGTGAPQVGPSETVSMKISQAYDIYVKPDSRGIFLLGLIYLIATPAVLLGFREIARFVRNRDYFG